MGLFSSILKALQEHQVLDTSSFIQKVGEIISSIQGNTDTITNKIDEKIPYPLLQFYDGTVLTNQRFFKKIEDGSAFSVSNRFEAVAADGTISMYFENPSTSSKKVYVLVVQVVSMAEFWIDIYRDNTITTNGTPIDPVNLNFGSDNESVAYVEYGGVYTTGNRVHNSVSPGGTRIRAIGAAMEVGECVLIPPGNNFLVIATNKSASSEDMSIRIIWWEE